MTALDFIAAHLAEYKRRPAHHRLLELADGSGATNRALANVISVCITLAGAAKATAATVKTLKDAVETLAVLNEAQNARLDRLESRITL